MPKTQTELLAECKFWKEQAYALSNAILQAEMDDTVFTETSTEAILDAQEKFVELSSLQPEDENDDA